LLGGNKKTRRKNRTGMQTPLGSPEKPADGKHKAVGFRVGRGGGLVWAQPTRKRIATIETVGRAKRLAGRSTAVGGVARGGKYQVSSKKARQ